MNLLRIQACMGLDPGLLEALIWIRVEIQPDPQPYRPVATILTRYDKRNILLYIMHTINVIYYNKLFFIIGMFLDWYLPTGPLQ